ncbi:uncharacterized protein UBRO_21034 [Ustilago bromivora]|uniref:DDE Tnp4 domain-containing protein n=1 Tax=Ustilago bromivora TaxID=307758 RepID=A0A1K0GWB7_9BASI|nr:uncharacterized protein UBRO_21034 [Ustilago bromivora]
MTRASSGSATNTCTVSENHILHHSQVNVLRMCYIASERSVQGSQPKPTRTQPSGYSQMYISTGLTQLVSLRTTGSTQTGFRRTTAYTGVEEWGKGWLVVNGTHVPLAWKPGVCSQEHFCYKGFHSMNVALVILPHLLWIVKSVVGQPGSVQDSKVWASGSNILKKPHLYLDEGEFIWVDGRYGHSAITVGPFSHIAADKSRDLQYFNYMLSQVRVRVKHAIAYLKNRFQYLTGYCGNIYHVEDHITAAQTIHASIVTHTFTS